MLGLAQTLYAKWHRLQSAAFSPQSAAFLTARACQKSGPCRGSLRKALNLCAHLGTYTLAMPFFEGRVNIAHCKLANCLRCLYYRERSASRSVHIASCAGPFVGVEASACSEEGLPDVKRTSYRRPPTGPSGMHPQGWCHRRRGNVNIFSPPLFPSDFLFTRRKT